MKRDEHSRRLNALLLPFCRRLSQFAGWAAVIAVVVYVLGRVNTRNLPDASAILPDLAQEPRQEMVEEEPFDFSYRGETYRIQPVARYELRGLVVTHNDITAFSDIYHTEDSVDVKDLCVIWGSNLEDNNFQKMRYWSEPWTCNFYTSSREVFRAFSKDELSNNHLLPASEEVRQKIADVEVGDQVSFSGLLINYAPLSHPDWIRKSSTVRTDTGNGACEVVFVENFSMLKEENPGWRKARISALRFFIFFVVMKGLLVLILPGIEFGAR